MRNMGLIKITAEMGPDCIQGGMVLRMGVYPKEREGRPMMVDYPLEIPMESDALVSYFDRVFDMVKMSFLEYIGERAKEEKFKEEFEKDPEGYIKRALEQKGS